MRRLVSAIALASTLAVVAANPSGAALTPTKVSGPSPYANCSNGAQPGTNYVNAEVEPSVSVNPTTVGTNKVNIAGVWQQDRWNNGGAHGLVAGFSFDGGVHWNETPLPFSACAAGAIADPITGLPYDRASDPWISFGPDGTAYTVGLLANNDESGSNDTGVAALTSTNGGKTWGHPNLIKFDKGTSPIFEFTQFFNDKESVTADPFRAATAYVVWDRLVSPSASPDADLFARAFRGPTWFSKTTDGGETWTRTRAIFDPGQNSQTIGNVIVVNSQTGDLYDFFDLFMQTTSPQALPRGDSVAFIKSTDGGNSWSAPTVVSTEQTVLDVDPNTGARLRTAETIPSVAIDPVSGQLYASWEDSRFSGGQFNEVAISTSSDGGKTWTAPARASTPTGRPAVTPTVAVNSAGTLAVMWYDFRNLTMTNTTTLPTDIWIRTAASGAASFGAESHLAGSFNMLVAPKAGGFFVGDYEGMGTAGTTFEPFFVQTNCADFSCISNRTDVYSSSV